MRSSEFEPRPGLGRNGELRHISLILPRVARGIERARFERRIAELQGSLSPARRLVSSKEARRSNGHGNDGDGLTNHEVALFHRAVLTGDIPDKDTLSEAVFGPTITEVINPAVRAYESTLRCECRVQPKDAKKAAKGARQRLESLALEAATVPAEERPSLMEEVGKFVNMFLPKDSLRLALRSLKGDFKREEVHTKVRHELFSQITRTK